MVLLLSQACTIQVCGNSETAQLVGDGKIVEEVEDTSTPTLEVKKD